MLTRSSLPRAEGDLYSKVRQMLTQPGLIRGSLVEMGRTCGKRGCACYEDKERRHRGLYLSANVGGKRSMIYVPQPWETRVRQWVEHYGRIRETLEKLSLACIRRLKARKE